VNISVDGADASNVLLSLKRSEATELRDALDALLDRFGEDGFHCHVSSDDYQTEVTITADVSR